VELQHLFHLDETKIILDIVEYHTYI